MTDTHAIPSTNGQEHSATPFSEAQLQEFHRNDRDAAAVLVLLMAGIFLVGVALYTVVAFVTY